MLSSPDAVADIVEVLAEAGRAGQGPRRPQAHQGSSRPHREPGHRRQRGRRRPDRGRRPERDLRCDRTTSYGVAALLRTGRHRGRPAGRSGGRQTDGTAHLSRRPFPPGCVRRPSPCGASRRRFPTPPGLPRQPERRRTGQDPAGPQRPPAVRPQPAVRQAAPRHRWSRCRWFAARQGHRDACGRPGRSKGHFHRPPSPAARPGGHRTGPADRPREGLERNLSQHGVRGGTAGLFHGLPTVRCVPGRHPPILVHRVKADGAGTGDFLQDTTDLGRIRGRARNGQDEVAL